MDPVVGNKDQGWVGVLMMSQVSKVVMYPQCACKIRSNEGVELQHSLFLCLPLREVLLIEP